jgi:PAS domain S-box-containing protein
MKKHRQPANSGIKQEPSSPKETPVRPEAESHPPRTVEETRRLVHELEVHQIELKMQNEELRQSREEFEFSRNKYTELYDFAPVGYFTFDAAGVIREANLAGAQLLGIEKRVLVNKHFSEFIADADERKIFSSHLESVMQRQGMKRCEIRLTGKDCAVIFGQLQSVTVDTIDSKVIFFPQSSMARLPSSWQRKSRNPRRNFPRSLMPCRR